MLIVADPTKAQAATPQQQAEVPALLEEAKALSSEVATLEQSVKDLDAALETTDEHLMSLVDRFLAEAQQSQAKQGLGSFYAAQVPWLDMGPDGSPVWSLAQRSDAPRWLPSTPTLPARWSAATVPGGIVAKTPLPSDYKLQETGSTPFVWTSPHDPNAPFDARQVLPAWSPFVACKVGRSRETWNPTLARVGDRGESSTVRASLVQRGEAIEIRIPYRVQVLAKRHNRLVVPLTDWMTRELVEEAPAGAGCPQPWQEILHRDRDGAIVDHLGLVFTVPTALATYGTVKWLEAGCPGVAWGCRHDAQTSFGERTAASMAKIGREVARVLQRPEVAIALLWGMGPVTGAAATVRYFEGGEPSRDLARSLVSGSIWPGLGPVMAVIAPNVTNKFLQFATSEMFYTLPGYISLVTHAEESRAKRDRLREELGAKQAKFLAKYKIPQVIAVAQQVLSIAAAILTLTGIGAAIGAISAAAAAALSAVTATLSQVIQVTSLALTVVALAYNLEQLSFAVQDARRLTRQIEAQLTQQQAELLAARAAAGVAETVAQDGAGAMSVPAVQSSGGPEGVKVAAAVAAAALSAWVLLRR